MSKVNVLHNISPLPEGYVRTATINRLMGQLIPKSKTHFRHIFYVVMVCYLALNIQNDDLVTQGNPQTSL